MQEICMFSENMLSYTIQSFRRTQMNCQPLAVDLCFNYLVGIIEKHIEFHKKYFRMDLSLKVNLNDPN